MENLRPFWNIQKGKSYEASLFHSENLCWDYAQRPDFYAVNSAPWYGQLLVNGVLTAVAALTMLLVLFLLKRKIKAS